MSKILLTLEFNQYDPGDDKPFCNKTTGIWLTASELKEYVIERIEKVDSMMDKDDQLTIMISAAPGEHEA